MLTSLLIFTLIVYLKLIITSVSTMPLAVTQTFPSNEDAFLRRVIRRQKRTRTHLAYLYTRHTGKFVKITHKGINALTTKDNKFAEILLTTHGVQGEHSIQGRHSKKFVCMNSKGRVILKKTFNKQQCMFYMRIHENGYVTFRLLNNEKWFLGFKKNGSIKVGHKTKYDHKAAWMMIQKPPLKKP